MVKIRLMRMGAKKRPFYRVVVADSRSPRDGRFIENIGKYHPLDDPSVIEIDEERALDWLRKGAQPSEPVVNLLRITGVWEKFTGQPAPAGAAATGGAKTAPVEESASQAAPAAPPEETRGEEAPAGGPVEA